MKKICLLSLILCFMLTACKNFLNAGKVKDEITSMIDYNNAPAYTILVEADRASGALLKPITGEVKKKATDVFPVKFEPNEGYKFQKWEATCTDTLSENDDISNYIVFEDETSLETNVTFKKGLKNIVIRPVCPAIPDAQIKIDGDNGNFSPSKGVYTKKAGSITSVIFDAQTDYEFIRWQIVNEETGAEIPNGKYIQLENPAESRTNFEVVDTPDPDSGITLLLKPVTMERPQVLSWGPDSENGRVTKDATIQVVFDRAIDEDSVYYTDEEHDKIGTTNIYWWHSEKNGRPYAYKDLTAENPVKVYKNIIIQYDDDPDSNINSCFGEPVFTTSKSLTLSVDRTLADDDLPKNWSSILVSFEKGFFYSVKIFEDSEKTKPVKMAKPKKWIYDVTDETDKVAPILKTYTVTTSGTDGTPISGKTLTITDKLSYANISSYASNQTIVYTNKMYVDFKLEDTNGMPKSFEIYYRKAFDEYYRRNDLEWTSKSILYHSTGKEASYKNEIDFTKGDYGFDDGLYQVYFKFTDASGNPRYYPQSATPDAENPPPPTNFFNICIDNGAHISYPNQTITPQENEMTLKLGEDLPGDFEKVILYYKQYNQSNSEYIQKTYNYDSTELSSATISNLLSWQTYVIKLEYYDYKGHKTEINPFNHTTKQPSITRKNLDFTNGNEFDIFDFGLSTWPGVPVELDIVKYDSNNRPIVNSPVISSRIQRDTKVELQRGQKYGIQIAIQRGADRVADFYTIFTEPKEPYVLFAPTYNDGNYYHIDYTIIRYDDENPNIEYIVSGIDSGTLPVFSVDAKDPDSLGCDLHNHSLFQTQIPDQPYATCEQIKTNDDSKISSLSIAPKKIKTLPSSQSALRTKVNILYNGETLVSNHNLNFLRSQMVDLQQPITPVTKATETEVFIIESRDNDNNLIARTKGVYCPPASLISDITGKSIGNKTFTVTWTNPPDDEFHTIKIYYTYRTGTSGTGIIDHPQLLAEITDKNTTSFTTEPIDYSHGDQNKRIIIKTTNIVGDEYPPDRITTTSYNLP